MKNNSSNCEFEKCSVRKSLEVLSGKWKLLIIHQFSDQNPIRYGQLKRLIPDISEKMLIQELKFLVKNGILSKKAYPEIPPRVEYSITKKGTEAFPIINLMEKFGNSYVSL